MPHINFSDRDFFPNKAFISKDPVPTIWGEKCQGIVKHISCKPLRIGSMVYLAKFTMKITQLWVNIPVPWILWVSSSLILASTLALYNLLESSFTVLDNRNQPFKVLRLLPKFPKKNTSRIEAYREA